MGDHTRSAELLRRELERLCGSGALEHLASRVSQFNLFEAIGMVRQEVRHSFLLAHLLDPRQSHGIGDAFLRAFLHRILRTRGESARSIPLDEPLDCAVVYREWEFVDVLVEVPSHRVVVLIENKVDSAEHSDQLCRYLGKVRERYPGWTLIPVFLTTGGTRASVDEFVPVPYGVVCEALDEILVAVPVIQPEVRVVLEHYRQMLRRHILSDSDIAQLCREIYREHKTALDLIFEHRPDSQSGIAGVLRGLIESEGAFRLLQKSKRYTTFVPAEWDESAILRSGHGWTFGGNRVLSFQFDNTETDLALHLWVGPVRQGEEHVRERLIELARSHQPPFTVAPKHIGPKFGSVYQKPFLTTADFESGEAADLETRIRDAWAAFLDTDLPAIQAVINGEQWLW